MAVITAILLSENSTATAIFVTELQLKSDQLCAMKALLWPKRRTSRPVYICDTEAAAFCPCLHSKVNHRHKVLINALWHESQFQFGQNSVSEEKCLKHKYLQGQLKEE